MIKKFLMKHVIKPDAKFTQDDFFMLAAAMSVPFMMFVTIMLVEIKKDIKEMDAANVADRCRVKYVIVNYDLTHSYMCKSETLGSIEDPIYYLIDEGESEKLDNNPYINRPVKLYKNGKKH